jgi:hypothetical protein
MITNKEGHRPAIESNLVASPGRCFGTAPKHSSLRYARSPLEIAGIAHLDADAFDLVQLLTADNTRFSTFPAASQRPPRVRPG